MLRLSVIGACCFGATIVAGCAGGEGWSENLLGAGRTGSTSLEWHDLDAAVAHASDIHGLALVSQSEVGGRRIYDLLTVTDEPVRIQFVAAGGEAAPARPEIEGPVEVTVQVGIFGDAARERAVQETLRERLDWLRRRD